MAGAPQPTRPSAPDLPCYVTALLAVGPGSPALQVSLINLNDGTCAGMFHPGLRAMTVQSHPEASPGPHDSDVAFTEWIELVKAEAAAANA